MTTYLLDKDLKDAAKKDSLDSLQIFINQAQKYPLLSKRQETKLAKKIEAGDLEAKQKMINSNLRLVINLARKYQNSTELSFLDLIQEGNLGLMHAVDKFDYTKGNKFSTYATFWIKQAIQRGIANKSKIIRIPVHVSQRERKLSLAKEELSKDNNLTDKNLLEKTGITESHLEEIRNMAKSVASVEQQFNYENDLTIEEVTDNQEMSTEDRVIQNYHILEVHSAVSKLPEREKNILNLRFGLQGNKPLSLRDTASKLGLSPERVRQLEKQALRKLKYRLSSLDY